MGTTSVELTIPKLAELLAPKGEFELKRIELKNEYSGVLAAAKKVTVIDSPESAEEATKLGRLLQVAVSETSAIFTNVKRMVDAVKKPLLEGEKADCGAYESEKKRLGELLTDFQITERRKREAEERAAREEAQRQAEADAQQRALELAAMGEDEAAEAVLEEPVVAAPVVIAATAPKPTGSVARKNYSIKVTDLKALVAAVAQGKVLLAAIEPNEAWLAQKARNEKEGFSVPGVELVVTESTSFRS